MCLCDVNEMKKKLKKMLGSIQGRMTRMLDLVMITGKKGMMIRMEKWSE